MRSAKRKEFLWSVFVTALEGGIGYWSKCDTYRWSIGDGKQEDYDNFHATVVDFVEHEEDLDKAPRLRIDADVIARGLRALAKGEATWGGRPLSEEGRKRYAKIDREMEGGDVDSDLADNIVQAGLFGDVRYG